MWILYTGSYDDSIRVNGNKNPVWSADFDFLEVGQELRLEIWILGIFATDELLRIYVVYPDSGTTLRFELN